MGSHLNRRRFLTVSAAGATGLLTGCATIGVRRRAPIDRLNHACIGVGGMGGGDLGSLRSHPNVEIVAICDVDKTRLEAAANGLPGVRQYTDWRELLAEEGDRIDSVNVSTPDHMHCAISLAAIRAGKHVYCQKPLAHDVAECRAMTNAVMQTGVVTQLGTQVASGAGDLMAVQFLRDGVIGKARRVILCSNRPGAVETYRLEGPRPPVGEEPPDTLEWDLWIGTAPMRPFVPRIYHPSLWRAWQDFGTGWSGDIGCHIFDAVWKGLDLVAPKSVVAEVQDSWRESKERRADTWPQSDHITWIFPGNDQTEGQELQVEWFDGDKYPPADVQAIAKAEGFEVYPPESAMVIGTEGSLLLPHGGGPVLCPSERFNGIPRPHLAGPSHYHRFVNACLGGELTESHFLQTGPMAEAIILGTVAIRVPGKVLEWDYRRMRIPNCREADRLVRRMYRKGWNVDLGNLSWRL
jgi:predicted dehydrogenase